MAKLSYTTKCIIIEKEIRYYEEYHRTHYFDEESMTWEKKKNG